MAREAGAENEAFLDEIALLLETAEATGELTPTRDAEPLADDLSLLFLHVEEDDLFANVETEAQAEPATAAAPNRSTAYRMRQREELQYLRDQVRELEERLETLQQTRKTGSSPSNTGDAESGEDTVKEQGMTTATSSMWERIAKNQMSAKQRAELENAKLREMLQGQLKIARGLERVLRKRSLLQMDAASLGAKRRRRVAAAPAGAVYEQLRLRLDDRYRELEAAFEQNGLSTNLVDFEDICVLSPGDSSQLSIEVLYAKVFPFDFASTSAAVWNCSTKSYLQLTQGFYSAEPVSNDEIAATFEVPLQVRRQSAMLHVYVALKRYRETNQREVYTWESWSTVGSSCKSYDGIQLLDHGWTVVESLPSSDPSSSTTIVRSCLRIISDEQSLPRQSPIGALSDILIANFNRNFATLYETVESSLMSTASR